MISDRAIRNFVGGSVYNMTPANERLSLWGWKVLQLWHAIHSLWLAWRIHGLMQAPGGLACASVGLALNAAFAQRHWFRIAIHLLAAAERLQAAVEAHRSLCQNSRKAKEMLFGRYRRCEKSPVGKQFFFRQR